MIQTTGTFLSIDEVYGVFTDAVLTDRGQLVFGSFWGHDTAIRELQARLTLGRSDVSGLTSLTMLDEQLVMPGKFSIDIDQFEQKTGRVQTNVLGSLVHCILYRKEIVQPDLANNRAIVIGCNRIPDNLWPLIMSVCPVPLLSKWESVLLPQLFETSMITVLDGFNQCGALIQISEDLISSIVKEGCLNGSLTT